MSFPYWISVAVVAFMPLAATAQQSQQANPADANATVPAVGYVSAFENYRATPNETATPDQLWRAANEEITSQDMDGGHGAMPGMATGSGPAPSGNHMSMPGMQHGTSGSKMPMPEMKPGTPGKHMSMPGMAMPMPEPKADAGPSEPHAGHHNMQGK